jgi:hemerythrin
MQRRKSKLRQQPSDEAEMLDRERFTIERQYIELDDAILHGQGSPRILEAARTLLQYLLLHFTHEEQFRKQISFPVLEDPRAVWKKNMAELLQIEAGLRQGEVYAALRLRSFCKGWMHMQKMWTSIFQPSLPPETGRAQA